MTGASAGGHPRRWVSLSEASRLLGIAPGTLRRWADDGSIPVFTTPGGHRRFSRSAIAALLPTERRKRPPLERLGASAERIARAYRSDKSGRGAWAWADVLSDADRAVFRERGRVLVERLLEHLDAPDGHSADERLAAAKRLAADYGRETGERGCSLSDAVQGFLRFRAPFTDELAALARRRGLDTREATELLADAEAAMDELLIAMMTGHTFEAGQRRRSARSAGAVEKVAGASIDDPPTTASTDDAPPFGRRAKTTGDEVEASGAAASDR